MLPTSEGLRFNVEDLNGARTTLADFFSGLLRGDAGLTLQFPYCYGECMSLPNWRIGRALGIPIHVHASWFLVFFFVTWSMATGYLPETLPGLSTPRYWGMGGIAALLLFLSVSAP